METQKATEPWGWRQCVILGDMGEIYLLEDVVEIYLQYHFIYKPVFVHFV